MSIMKRILVVLCVAAFFVPALSTTPADVDWYSLGRESLDDLLGLPPPAPRRAKNVVLFIGDGMGVSTVTAARSFKGEINGNTGPEQNLVFEDFPHVALSKTYTHSHQVADSAATATAIMSGVKTTNGVIGVNIHQPLSTCANISHNTVDSIFRWAQLAGKSTGIVTNTRITHATPAAAYAHVPYREYEAFLGPNHDDNLKDGCTDIAYQLVHGPTGKDLNVILGGGLRSFLPKNVTGSRRVDDIDLIQDWKDIKYNTGRPYSYVTNITDLMKVDKSSTDYLLGLFAMDHMEWEMKRNQTLEPSLTEMTQVAIETLQTNDDGYVLLIEGGRIDHGHHSCTAKDALVETLALEDAVQKAVELSSGEDTLIIVTADHSHTLTIGGGQPTRGNPILGVVDEYGAPYFVPLDGKNMTTLSYANGPGGLRPGEARSNPSDQDTGADDYVFESLVPLGLESHGGEEVGIYALGPMSHLFRGVMEQNVIAHVMAHAACLGDYTDCSWSEEKTTDEPATCGARAMIVQRSTELTTAAAAGLALVLCVLVFS